jgi:hypothetical protein
MDEYVFRTIVRRDEAEASCLVEEFHNTCCHVPTFAV